LALKTVPQGDNPELHKFHFQQAERMLLFTFIAGLIGNAGQQMRIKLPQLLDVALQIAVTVFEAEALEKRNETFYADSEKVLLMMAHVMENVLMMAHVMENLVTLISSRELVCGQKEGRNLQATERLEES